MWNVTQSFKKNSVIRSLRQIQSELQEEESYAAWGTKWNILFLSDGFSSLFSRKLLAWQNTASTENSYRFSATKVPLLRRNEDANSSSSNHPLSYTMKTLVLDNIHVFKIFSCAFTFLTGVCQLGITRNILFYQNDICINLARGECESRARDLEYICMKAQGFLIQLKGEWLESWKAQYKNATNQ